MSSPSFEVSQAQLAWLLGVSPKTVQQWDAEGLAEAARLGMDGRSARYDPRRALAWRDEREEELRRKQSQVSALDQAKLEQAQLEVRRRQIEVARAEGQVIDKVDSDAIVSRLVEVFLTAALALPAWGPRITGLVSAAEGTEAMKAISEDLISEVRSFAEELEVEGLGLDEEIPPEFPGYRALAAFGIKTLTELRALQDPQEVKGIGPKLAEQINLALTGIAA